MTQVYERFELRCPYVRARQYLHEAIEPSADSPLPQIVRLTATLPNTDVSLAKLVRVQYAHADDPMHFDEMWKIRWAPEGGGIYPTFEGMLTVRADDTYERAILELKGEYKPPLGSAGAVFDAAVGHRIAGGTAQKLLFEIAEGMEARYKREEAAKIDVVLPHG